MARTELGQSPDDGGVVVQGEAGWRQVLEPRQDASAQGGGDLSVRVYVTVRGIK